jgi:peptidyl-prolyl cis-trans isomerase SurA
MKKTNQILLTVVAIVIAIAAGWFFVSQTRSNPKTTGQQDLNLNGDKKSNNNQVVAKVNDEEISSRELESLKQSFGQRAEQVSDKEILDQLINKKLILQEARKQGYSITDQEAESMLKSRLQQQNKSLEEYKQQLNSQGGSYESQLSKLKDDLVIQKYLQEEFKNKDFEATEEEAKNFYDKRAAQSSNGQLPPFEQVAPQMKQAVKQQKRGQAIESLAQQLRKDANIEYVKEF